MTKSCPLSSSYVQSFAEVNQETVKMILATMWVRLPASAVSRIVSEYQAEFIQTFGRSFTEFLRLNEEQKQPARRDDLVTGLERTLVEFWVNRLIDPQVANSSGLWDNLCGMDFPDAFTVFYQAALQEGLIPTGASSAGFAQWLFQYQTDDDTPIEWTREIFGY